MAGLKGLLAVGVGAALVGAIGVASPALGDVEHFYPSKVTIHKSFTGEISSDKGKCERDRVVHLKRRRSGKDKKVGTDTTGHAGKWKIPKDHPSGKYYAKAPEVTYMKAGGDIVCGADKSRTVTK